MKTFPPAAGAAAWAWWGLGVFSALAAQVAGVNSQVPFQASLLPPSIPEPCAQTGRNPGNWTPFRRPSVFDASAASAPHNVLIFETSIGSKLFGHDSHFYIRACLADASDSALGPAQADNLDNLVPGPECSPDAVLASTTEDMELILWGTSSQHDSDAASTAARTLASFFVAGSLLDCKQSTLFARLGNTTVGVFVGDTIQKTSVVSAIAKFAEAVARTGGQRAALQLCGERRAGIFGIFSDSRGNISAVQEALRTWKDGSCLAGFDRHEVVKGVPIAVMATPEVEGGSLTRRADCKSVQAVSGDGCWALSDRCGGTSFSDLEKFNKDAKLNCNTGNLFAGQYYCCSSGTLPDKSPKPNADGSCKYVQAVSGDGCWALGERCGGTSVSDLEKFNKDAKLNCNTGNLFAGQNYCCSSGNLPDLSPKPNADGSCKTYTIDGTLYCADIAAKYQVGNWSKIEEYNKQTWGWRGCTKLEPGMEICISKGTPPMPHQHPEGKVICGPQMMGTKRPTNGTSIAELNPCPLNACCSVWGWCGTTTEFCTPSKSETGAPGTAKEGEAGCISNCGTDIVNNKNGPAQFAKVGYFEGWNKERPCANMDAYQLDALDFTHIHFAFGEITRDLVVDMNTVQDQFDQFLALKGPKRILSFGGWAFSAELSVGKWDIFRNAVTPGRRETLANNVVKFVKDTNLDGVDFDWEYPEASDLPDLPPDSLDNGENYLEFLKLVRQKLPSGKTLAIAAPASYWYLKGFPIAEIAKVVDYIIFMTYDYHGQWDFGNRWAIEGCPAGNCLRSHVNRTETLNALSMITKAGVPTNKIIAGVSSYGRSFKMAREGCTGPMCTFLAQGPKNESMAAKGRCTGTAGYIGDVEIRDIIEQGRGKSTFDQGSRSDILVYDKTEWVAWMDTTTKASRTAEYQRLKLGGTSDWAVDLNLGGMSLSDAEESEFWAESEPLCDPGLSWNTLADLDKASFPAGCGALYTIQTALKMLDGAIGAYAAASQDYDTAFDWYVKLIENSIQPQLDKCIDWEDNGPCNKFFYCTWRENGKVRNEGACPLGKHDRSLFWVYELTYTLKDEAGFFKTLLEQYGIQKEWVKFGDVHNVYRCKPTERDKPGSGIRNITLPAEISRRDEDALDKRQCEDENRHELGRPLKADKVEVANPKKIVEAAVPNLGLLRAGLVAQWSSMALGTWGGNNEEAAQVAAQPVFMIAQAVESMHKMRDMGLDYKKEVNERQTRDLVLLILTIVLFFIPVVGEVGVALGFTTATVARIAILIGFVGDAALTAVSVVDDPLMAPIAALGMFVGLGGGAARTPGRVAEIAKGQRAMRASGAVAKMGDLFKRNDDLLQKVASTCRRS